MPYTGQTYRGVDYQPTWPGWTQPPADKPNQLTDADFYNDAFASLWANKYQPAPSGLSKPTDNGANYRDDLGTIARDGFNLVRLYDWDMARGTTSSSDSGPDHVNFLTYANNLGVKVVVPVSNYFLSNNEFAWNNKTPDSSYSFGSAPDAIQKDFKQFVASITDPATGKIHAGVHSISIGNETEIGTGPIAQGTPTTASDALARINWWIYNLHRQINGTGTGPDGDPVVGNPSIVPISATFANGDQTGPNGSWFKALLFGVQPGQGTPSVWATDHSTTFTKAVTGLATIDPGYASYYYNSFNIGQSTSVAPFGNGIANTLALYDNQATPWPGSSGNVPLLLMEVFTPNRDGYPTPADQATAAVNEATTLRDYLASHKAGTPDSTTNLMGFNYFSFQDEPVISKQVGLYQYSGASADAKTGTTSLFYGGFGDLTFPVYTLTPTPGPDGKTLAKAWTGNFTANTFRGTEGNDNLAGSPENETFQGLAGNDSIVGGPGLDTAVFAQNASGYALKTTAGSPTITAVAKLGTEGTDSLTGIEQVFFSNQSVDLSTISKTAALPAAQVLKVVDLYTAGLGRAPDALGLDYWASRLADGANLGDVAKGIFGAPEVSAIYSPVHTSQTFVNLVYGTVFGRAADAAGQTYWTNELDTGHLARTDLVSALVAGATGTDKQYVANREAVGGHFGLTQGLNNASWAKTVLSAVNATAASVTSADAQTDAFAAIAATPATSELVVQIVGVVA